MKHLSWFIGVTALLLYALYEMYVLLMPKVIIENISGEAVKSVTVMLPGSRLVFGPIAQGEVHTIYYSLNQKDGTYRYQVIYDDNDEIVAECGYITANEIGKTFQFTLRVKRIVTCSG